MEVHKTSWLVEHGVQRQRIIGVLFCAIWASLVGGVCHNGIAQEIEVCRTLKAVKPDLFFSLDFSPNGKTLAFTDGVGGVKLWDLARNEERPALTKKVLEGRALCLAFSPDGNTLALGRIGDVLLWDLLTGKEKFRIAATEKPNARLNKGELLLLRKVAFTPDGNMLVAVSPTRNARLWDLQTRKVLLNFPSQVSASPTVSFSPDSEILAVVAGGGVDLWRVKAGKLPATLKANSPIECAAFSPDGKTLATGGMLMELKLRDVESRKATATFEKPAGADRAVFGFTGIAFSPDGRMLAALDKSGGTIRLWEVTSRKIRAVLGMKNRTLGFAFSPDGRLLAAGCQDGSLDLWDLASVKRKPPGMAEIDHFWPSLAGEDAVLAYQTIRTLAAFPQQALPSLRKQLRPVSRSEEMTRKIERWLVDLDSDEFDKRQKASEELAKCGVLAEGALRRALAEQPSLELRKRVSAILEGIERQKAIEPIQQLRALEVLEHIGTAEARGLLAELAKGVPEARLTQEAKASLRRLSKRLAATP